MTVKLDGIYRTIRPKIIRDIANATKLITEAYDNSVLPYRGNR